MRENDIKGKRDMWNNMNGHEVEPMHVWWKQQ